jgi:signal transduction histidine kinase/DNA-binding response OmpR family regulator
MNTSRWIIFFTFLMLILLGNFYYDWKSTEQDIYKHHINFNKSIYKTTSSQYQMLADSIFDEVINQEPVLEIVSKIANASTEQKKQLRDRLYKQLFSVYQRLKKQKFRQMHFHLPNNTSILRFHRLEHFGDILTADRYSVKLSNETRQRVHGFESGKHFHAFRNVYPLNYKEKNVGTMEISLPVETILESMEHLDENLGFMFVMKKSYVFSKLYISEQEIYKTLPINNDYVYESISIQNNNQKKTKTTLISNIHQKLLHQQAEIQEKMLLGEQFVLPLWTNKSIYLLTFLPISDIKGEQRAFIIFYTMAKELRQLQKNFIISICIAAVFILTLFFFIWKQFRSKQLLIKAKQEAELGNKSKSEFITNISHEIRTPLNGILGMASLLSLTTLDDKQKHLLTLLDQSGNSLLRVINDILDMSKLHGGDFKLKLQVFNLEQLIDNIEAVFQEPCKQKKIKFMVQRHLSLPTQFYKGDAQRISQVVFNLLDNALKFTEEGYVSLSIYAKMLDKHNIHLTFEISDTGVGIDHVYQKQIFQAFSQADGSITRKFGGTGLGLIVSKKIALLMNGELSFDSALGIGSTFTFEFPLATAEHQTENTKSIEKPIEKEKIIASSPHILLVEDNIINQEVATSTLNYLGCEVTLCPDGKKAVNAFKKSNFDLVLMDISMPVMDGIKATEYIRKYEKHTGQKSTPIIALTAHASKDFKEKTLTVDMNDLLTKPFTINEMDNILKKWLSTLKSNNTPNKSKQASVLQQQTTVENNNTDNDAKVIENIIDRDSYIQLQQVKQSGDIHIIERVLKSYLLELPKLLTEIKTSLENKDSETLWKTAHSLKSSSINIGAIQFSEICLEIESLGKQGQLNVKLVEQLTTDSEAVQAALQQLLDEESASNI